MAKPDWLAEGPDLDLTAGIPDPPSPPSNALLQGMTDEQLQAIRELATEKAWKDCPGLLADFAALIAEVDRLRDIIRRAYDGDPDDLYEEGERLSGEASQQERT